MALPARRSGSYSPLMIVLLSGLSALAWISTYSGMLQLIAASSGDIGIPAKIAIGLAVFMLQGMIVYILDALFSGQLRLVLYPVYIIGYIILVLVSVAFAFGFYWRFLEAGAQTTQAAGSSVSRVEQELQAGQSRLELLQTTLTALSAISSQKAETERVSGRTCPNSRAGDGPRRRLRDSDAQRFQFASNLIGARTNAVKTDIEDLNKELQRVLKKDPSTIDPETGTRTAFIEGLDGKVGLVTTGSTRCAATRRSGKSGIEFQARAKQTVFPDDRGGTFHCPDGQLQTALNGVVRSIDDLPELRKPELRSSEGSEAVIEAFRRLSNTAIGLIHGKLPPSPEEIRARQSQQKQPSGPAALSPEDAGLSDRDYIPLLIAIFVDVCILLVSVNRPFGPFFNLGQDLSRARQRGPMQGVLETFYRVFQDEFHLPDGGMPTPVELVAPLQDVVFDYRGDYYAAVPLDYREQNYEQWAKARANAPSFQSTRALERSRYLAAIFAVLEGENLVRLLGVERRSRFDRNLDGLDEDTVRAKLDKQGSMYAQADAFRIYRFRPGKWADLLIQTVGAAAARQDADTLSRKGDEVFAGWLRGRRVPPALPKRPDQGSGRIAAGEEKKQIEDARPRVPGKRTG